MACWIKVLPLFSDLLLIDGCHNQRFLINHRIDYPFAIRPRKT